MRANEFLAELWTQPYELISRATGPANREYEFKTKDNRPGRIVFDSFLDTDQGGTHVVLVLVHFYIDNNFRTSGKGDAVAIFSTVVAACRDYLRRYKPPVVAFETDDDKKRNLYAKMAGMFPDYVIYPYPQWGRDPVVGDEIFDSLMDANPKAAVVLHRRDYVPEKTRVYVEDESHENTDNLDSLKEACENWMEMYFDANDINTILTHPYSQQFKQPPAGVDRLYRGLVVSGGKVKAVPGKSNRKFVAYATHPYGAEAFLASLDVSGRKVIIEKQFNPADFMLDFTGLYESLFPDQGLHNRYETEYEVWMRATKYYQSASEKEIVSDTAWGQTDDGEPGRGGLYELTDNDYYGGNDDDSILPWAEALAAFKQWAEDSNALDFEEKDGGRTAAITWGPELGAPYSGYIMFVSPHGDGEMYGMLMGMYEDGEFDVIQDFKVPCSYNGVDYAARVYMQVRM